MLSRRIPELSLRAVPDQIVRYVICESWLHFSFSYIEVHCVKAVFAFIRTLDPSKETKKGSYL